MNKKEIHKKKYIFSHACINITKQSISGIGLVFKPYCRNVNFTVKRHLENMIFQQKQELA